MFSSTNNTPFPQYYFPSSSPYHHPPPPPPPPPPPMVNHLDPNGGDFFFHHYHHHHHHDPLSVPFLLASNNNNNINPQININPEDNTPTAINLGVNSTNITKGSHDMISSTSTSTHNNNIHHHGLAPNFLPKKPTKKDRHSKIYTAQGLRDRRVRLSIEIAREFFDLHDTLGFDKASKTLEWLLSKSKKAIKDLYKTGTSTTRTNNKLSSSKSLSSTTSECEDQAAVCSEVNENLEAEEEEEEEEEAKEGDEEEMLMVSNKKGSTSSTTNNKLSEAALMNLVAKESRAKARARARARTKEKRYIMYNTTTNNNNNCTTTITSSTKIRSIHQCGGSSSQISNHHQFGTQMLMMMNSHLHDDDDDDDDDDQAADRERLISPNLAFDQSNRENGLNRDQLEEEYSSIVMRRNNHKLKMIKFQPSISSSTSVTFNGDDVHDHLQRHLCGVSSRGTTQSSNDNVIFNAPTSLLLPQNWDTNRTTTASVRPIFPENT